MTTQLGCTLLLTDDSRRVNWLHYATYKIKIFVRYVLKGETYAFADGFDHSFFMPNYLERLLGRNFPLTILTNSEFLFRIIVKVSPTTERRFTVDFCAVR